MTSVVVAVLTYRRPEDLEAVLPLVAEQAAACEPPARVLVVDNDPGASARPAVEGSALERVSYAWEPQPGIAAARNRALLEAAGDDVLVFLDDDERPGPGWLQHLLDVRAATGSAGVVGPVVSSFATAPDPWIEAGLQLVWCDEAVVTDVVPASRATRSWVLRRALRSGNGWVRVALAMAPTAAARVRVRVGLTARGSLRAAGGGARMALGALVGRAEDRKSVV